MFYSIYSNFFVVGIAIYIKLLLLVYLGKKDLHIDKQKSILKNSTA